MQVVILIQAIAQVAANKWSNVQVLRLLHLLSQFDLTAELWT